MSGEAKPLPEATEILAPETHIALSIRQPWAWLIVRPDLIGTERAAAVHAGVLKDIENRSWPTRFRGRFLIHAAQSLTRAQYNAAAQVLREARRVDLTEADMPRIELPPLQELQRGGIVGHATLVQCVPHSERQSRWHMQGHHGFKLQDAQPLPFRPLKGRLGFFKVPNASVVPK
ncbi:ASCH domain-containing protein [Hydrogenophaga sp. PML113]|jgi:hypothetical protein|uniref:ASCH domain-containing protein n=1 Tax=Hydrogenophaga sp. PML113 TaxID=1899350 RepID=UPI0020C7D472|nr:ASCH domain-containing protein [Hydrogenophaga sp. PML113]